MLEPLDEYPWERDEVLDLTYEDVERAYEQWRTEKNESIDLPYPE